MFWLSPSISDSHRDYLHANELTIKTAFLTLLYNDILYIIDSETALERTYADLTMIIRPEARRFQTLDILIEFKYVSLGNVGLTDAEAKVKSIEELHVATLEYLPARCDSSRQ